MLCWSPEWFCIALNKLWNFCSMWWLIVINILAIILLFIIVKLTRSEEKKKIIPNFNEEFYELSYVHTSFVSSKDAWFRKIPLRLPRIFLHVSIEVAEFLCLENFYRYGMIHDRSLLSRMLLDTLRSPEERSFTLSDSKWDSVQVKGFFFYSSKGHSLSSLSPSKQWTSRRVNMV